MGRYGMLGAGSDGTEGQESHRPGFAAQLCQSQHLALYPPPHRLQGTHPMPGTILITLHT